MCDIHVHILPTCMHVSKKEQRPGMNILEVPVVNHYWGVDNRRTVHSICRARSFQKAKERRHKFHGCALIGENLSGWGYQRNKKKRMKALN